MGFGPSERPLEAIFSIVLNPRWVTLCFLYGVELPDPDGLLQGGGNRVRHIRLESASVLDRPAVRALISAAAKQAEPPFNPRGPRRLVIRSISAKRRPRRPLL